MQSIIAFIIRHRKAVLTLTLLFTLGLATQIRNLQIVIDPVAMLPKEHPNVIGTTLAEKLFGNKYVVVVGVTAKDGGTVLRPEVLNVVQDLTRKIATLPGVKRHTIMSVVAPKAKSIEGSEGTLNVEPLLSPPITSQGVEQLVQRLDSNPVYQGTLVSKDRSLTSISFSVDVGPKGFRKVIAPIEAVVHQADGALVQTTMSGTPVYFATVERYSQRMAFLFPIALVLIGLLHFEAFRSLQGMFLPLVTALLAVIWVLGIMGAIHMPMDAFNATTPILILAVAAGHAVQILKRYYEEYDRLREADPVGDAVQCNQQAVLVSLTRMAPVMLTAGLVAAAGFFSLLTFDILTIRTFGVITGLGIVAALWLELTFIPALRCMLKPPARAAAGSQPPSDKPRVWDRIAERISDTVILRPKRILLSFLALAIVASSGIFFINQENSTKSYFARNVEVREQDRFLNQELAGTNTLYVIFKGDRADRMKDPDVLNRIDAAQRYIETLPEVGKTISIVDFLKRMNQAMNGGAPEQFVVPASTALASQYLLLYSMSGEPTDFDAYIDYDYRNANLVVWARDDSSKYAAMIVDKIRQHVGRDLPPGVSIEIGGSVPQTSALSDTLVHGKLLNIVQMISVVFLAGVVVFRSLLASLYLIVPLLVTVLCNFGLMGLTGIPLNTPNSVSSALAIGIGADYAIYLMFRIREALQAHGNLELALRETLRTAGKAVMYVATAVAIGYAVLMLSVGFYPHVWLGALISMSMMISAITALTLVPTLIRFRPPRFFRTETNVDSGKSAALVTGLVIAVGVAMLAGLLYTSHAHSAELGAQDIMTRSYLSTRLDSSVSRSVFTLTNASGQERVRKTFGVTKQGSGDLGSRRMVRFLSPGDVRNTATLLVESGKGEDEIWVYLPALKKARRVAGGNKKGSFMGTDLSYGDVMGYRPELWRHRVLREEELAGKPCWVIESTPASQAESADSGYSRRVSWVEKDNFVAVQVEAYDAGGALLKTVLSKDLKQVDAGKGKWQAMQILVKNHQTGHATRVQFDQFDANVPVPDEDFSVRYLEKEQ